MKQPSIQELEQGLLIDENALDTALMHQADCFYRVSGRLAELISLRDEAKSQLADAEARIGISIRERLRTEDDKKKPPEGEINARIRINSVVSAANAKLLNLQKQVGQYSALKESFEQRSYALNKMVELYTAGYFGEVTHKKQINDFKDAKSGVVRNRMNEMRQSRGSSNND